MKLQFLGKFYNEKIIFDDNEKIIFDETKGRLIMLCPEYLRVHLE